MLKMTQCAVHIRAIVRVMWIRQENPSGRDFRKGVRIVAGSTFFILHSFERSLLAVAGLARNAREHVRVARGHLVRYGNIVLLVASQAVL